ncbi:MAG: DUF475 domain-containing protein [Candidatus Margulisiibacteriota bacterium]
MDLFTIIMIVVGLCLFEIISSIDNAIINAEVLTTMSPRARRWFLFWGLLIAVFIIRGVLPWIIIWVVNPGLGPIGSFMATFSNDPSIKHSIEQSAPILMAGGGIFLVFLFLHWLFLEEKNFGLPRTEKFFLSQGVWFYATVSLLLTGIVWQALKINNMMALGAVIGSTAFFITHGFKQNAEENEKKMLTTKLTDISKIFYLEIIDATFSIDGVLGAFAFTLSIPLILIGNGIGALVVRQLTIKGIGKIKQYVFLKNGAMYSIFFLGLIMLLRAFNYPVPELVSPIITFFIIGYFFIRSKRMIGA